MKWELQPTRRSRALGCGRVLNINQILQIVKLFFHFFFLGHLVNL